MKLYDYLLKNRELNLQEIQVNPKEYYYSLMVRKNFENVCFFASLTIMFVSFLVVFCILCLEGVLS